MSGFTGINQFGNLTLQNGQRLSFKDIKDVDGDGKISKDEFNAFLKENNVDTIELSLVDKNGDGEISEQEYAILEQKQQMQEAVNAMAQDISIDFAGTTLIPEVTAKLKDLVANYENNYNGDIAKMAESFKRELPEKYEAIKNEILANDPNTVKTNVVNDIVAGLANEEGMTAAAQKTLASQLEAVSNTFIKGYKGANLAEDLKAHLNEWLTKTDAEKVSDDVAAYQNRIGRYGATIENSELAGLKECAKYLLTSALDKGVTVKLGEQTVSKSNLEAVLNKYTDGETLKADIQAFIDGLSTVNKMEQILADEAAKADAAAEKAFTDIKGSEYQIDIKDLELPQEYYDNKSYSKKGKGQDYYKNDAREKLNALKDQIKAQITSMLESKGVPFEKIATIFENVYTMSTEEAVNSAVHGRHGTWFRKSKSEYNVQNLINTFVEVFNKNIAAEIDKVNASNTDFDTTDVNYADLMTTDENGNVDEGMKNALTTGKTLETKGNGSSYYDEQANTMIDRLKSTMMTKARSMCLANGIEFDQKAFETRFDSAKKLAIANSTDGQHGTWFRKSKSTFNPQQLCTTFTTEFKTNYTAWVEAEKAKLANK